MANRKPNIHSEISDQANKVFSALRNDSSNFSSLAADPSLPKKIEAVKIVPIVPKPEASAPYNFQNKTKSV